MRVFKEIVDNIAQLGLKRPITVAKRNQPGETRYDLVCGQGRLEALRALKQSTIPAVVIAANCEDCMVMSLVENLARRQHRGIDLFTYPGSKTPRVRRDTHCLLPWNTLELWCILWIVARIAYFRPSKWAICL
jgi:ParB family transcriptional regulator, chromosome partitioning protein